MAPLIPSVEIVNLPNDVDFGIRSEPSTSTPIKTSKTSAKKSAQVKPSAQSKPSAQVKPSAQSKPSAQVKPAAQAKPSTSNEPTREAIKILDFSNVLPAMPKNVYTEFYDIFPVKQPNIKKLKKEQKKAYNAQTKIYRKRKWEHIGRNISQAEKETNKAKALKEGYIMGDDGKTQFTIKAYHGVKRGYFGRVYQWL